MSGDDVPCMRPETPEKRPERLCPSRSPGLAHVTCALDGPATAVSPQLPALTEVEAAMTHASLMIWGGAHTAEASKVRSSCRGKDMARAMAPWHGRRVRGSRCHDSPAISLGSSHFHLARAQIKLRAVTEQDMACIPPALYHNHADYRSHRTTPLSSKQLQK